MMKRIFHPSILSVAMIAIAVDLAFSSALTKPIAKKEYRNVGYVFHKNCDINTLDVTKITHLNYSFGLIYNREYEELGNETNPDVIVPHDFDDSLLHTIYLSDKVESDLSRIYILKEKNPVLKILLSVGGWGCRGFSDAAASNDARKAFAQSCRKIIDRFGLDGIDLDWEYPVIGGWGSIKSRPEDKQNLTLLLKEVRKTIGNDKLLTIAGSPSVSFSNGEWIEFQNVIDLLDYINIMTYDFGNGTCYFDSALYPSKTWKTKSDHDDYNIDMAVKLYLKNGCPAEKINVGISFGASIPKVVVSNNKLWKAISKKLNTVGFFTSKDPLIKKVKDLLEDKNGFHKEWDEQAKTMYISTDLLNVRQFVMSYIEPQGLSERTKYIKDNNLGGIMFWEFGADYDNSLVSQIARELDINRLGEKP
ncbi:MAG TPA: glycosyl hydrolase family 18 protein [Rectinema sp.]|jgi:chitinase|nr:glycosyl hydrolase family 18 protein [Rectinema sp.]HOM93096.1 glycosyl hydrolase family 18 protein [Rectinema sp.]